MKIDEFDQVDLARKAGALHLLPENADFYAELIRICAVVAGLPTASEPLLQITDYEWKEWINSSEPMHEAPEIAGDPAEGPLVVEVPCFGGAYLTVPADNPEEPFMLGCLMDAIFHRLDVNYGEFKNEAAAISTLGLWLSDQCVRRAGLRRNEPPRDSENGDIRWPHSELARNLENAVSFQFEEVAAAMSQRAVTMMGLDVLGFHFGNVSLEYQSPRENPVCQRPILNCGKEIIVISPSSIVPAIRNALLDCAAESGFEKELVVAYRESVFEQVRKHADLQQWEPMGTRDVNGSACEIRQSMFQIDADKVVVLYLVCDDLGSSAESPDCGWWELKPAVAEVENCISVTEEELLALSNAPQEILHVLVVQGIGRHYVLGFDTSSNSATPRLALSADEFVVFSLLNLNDSIALWRVVRARDRLPPTFGMIAGFLDHYAIYRRRGDSYYFDDAGIPDFVSFSATGMEVRLEAQERLDPHFVRHPLSGSFRKVIRLQSRSDFPIYAVESREDRPIELLVEGLPVPVWVIVNEEVLGRFPNSRDLFFHVADAIAFWVWQLSPSLHPLLARSAQNPPSLNIHVSFHDPELWLAHEVRSEASLGIAVSEREDASLLIEFSPPFAAHASRAENVAERELAKVLAIEIPALMGVPVSEDEAKAIIDRHAPLGEKRRFMVLRGIAEETVNTDALPRFREVQAFDEHALSDAVGAHLRSTLQVDPGEISDEQENSVCHAAVKYLYGELQASIAKLSSDNLVEQLISRHESLIAQRRLLEITMATHLACFGDSEEYIAEFQKDFVSVDKASIASRFLLECVATCPPNGTSRLSMSNYDRLLAIASEIAYLGRISDSLHYQIGRQEFELLGSGRLAISDPRFESAMKGVQDKFYRRLAGSSREEFYRAVSTAKTTEAPDDLAEIERVTAAEFGLPITQLVDLLAAIATSPGTDASGTGSCERSKLVGHLSAATGLEETVVDSFLCQFSLEERDNLLSPPPPYEQADVYPWRFNRGLSYLRRPVITRGKGAQIWSVWGRRALLQAANYLVRLCSTGRLKSPQSAEMSSYQGRIAERTGRRFNDHVATEVGKLPQYVVRKQIKKFDGKRITRINGDSLGDVDVLAAEPTSQVIYLIEAKCFSLAKTPVELANEREELFGDLAGKAGAAGRHLERTDWIQENLSSVMRELSISSTDPRQWQVVPLMVLDSDLVSPRLVDPPFSVLALDELIDFLSHK